MTSTIEQFRRDIDSGLTADKTSVIDPAAAPLGADEEAAGTPLSAQVITDTHEHELALGREVLAQRRGYLEAALVVLLTLIVTCALVALTSSWHHWL